MHLCNNVFCVAIRDILRINNSNMNYMQPERFDCLCCHPHINYCKPMWERRVYAFALKCTKFSCLTLEYAIKSRSSTFLNGLNSLEQHFDVACKHFHLTINLYLFRFEWKNVSFLYTSSWCMRRQMGCARLEPIAKLPFDLVTTIILDSFCDFFLIILWCRHATIHNTLQIRNI